MTHTAHAPLMTMPLPERTSILESALTRSMTRDARLKSRTATVAVVEYQSARRNSFTRLLVTGMKTGLGLFVRTTAVENAKSSRVMLTVDERGTITRLVLPG